MHAKYEVSISYGSKVIAKVKVDNKQTNRQDKNNTRIPRIIRSGGSGGIKTLWLYRCQMHYDNLHAVRRYFLQSLITFGVLCRHDYVKVATCFVIWIYRFTKARNAGLFHFAYPWNVCGFKFQPLEFPAKLWINIYGGVYQSGRNENFDFWGPNPVWFHIRFSNILLWCFILNNVA